MNEWFRLAFLPSVIRRSLTYALIVGTILTAINHGPAILQAQMTPGRWLQVGLTVLVPYTVSTLSSVGAMRKMQADAAASAKHSPGANPS